MEFLLFSRIFSIYIYESDYIFICEMWLFNLLFSPVLQIWYVDVRISRNVSESPLDFEITKVECSIEDVMEVPQSKNIAYQWHQEES